MLFLIRITSHQPELCATMTIILILARAILCVNNNMSPFFLAAGVIFFFGEGLGYVHVFDSLTYHVFSTVSCN